MVLMETGEEGERERGPWWDGMGWLSRVGDCAGVGGACLTGRIKSFEEVGCLEMPQGCVECISCEIECSKAKIGFVVDWLVLSQFYRILRFAGKK